MLAVLYPLVAARACDDCKKFVYQQDGTVLRRPLKIGLPVLRGPGEPLPCQSCPKVPAGAKPEPASAVELDAAGWQAYGHYLEMKAVGFQVPDVADPVVRRNAALIRAAEDEAQAVLERRRHELLVARLQVKRATP